MSCAAGATHDLLSDQCREGVHIGLRYEAGRVSGPSVNGAPSLVWFRQDLRLSDNPALAAAMERGATIIPVYIWAPEEEGAWPPGAASKWWLGRSLAVLQAELERRGSRLIVRRGPTEDTLRSVASETGAAAVFWNRRYEPAAVR